MLWVIWYNFGIQVIITKEMTDELRTLYVVIYMYMMLYDVIQPKNFVAQRKKDRRILREMKDYLQIFCTDGSCLFEGNFKEREKRWRRIVWAGNESGGQII